MLLREHVGRVRDGLVSQSRWVDWAASAMTFGSSAAQVTVIHAGFDPSGAQTGRLRGRTVLVE